MTHTKFMCTYYGLISIYVHRYLNTFILVKRIVSDSSPFYIVNKILTPTTKNIQ